MFKFFLYFNFALVFITLNECKYYKRGPLNKDGDAPWPNLWFPYPPGYEKQVKPQIINVTVAPEAKVENLRSESKSVEPSEPEFTTGIAANTSHNSSNWTGLWFPFPPGYEHDQKVKQNASQIKDMPGQSHECDNGKENIQVDFDPEDKRHSFNYLCLDNRTKYEPNLNTSALLKEYSIPAAYEPPKKCLSEYLEYPMSIPTYGAFRPLAPAFGSYIYLPAQRWLHSLADGAIVMLYHPCAFAGQVERLQNILKSCLYRHIITPSQQLTPERPLALVAWGKSLEMSVVDNNIVSSFIKKNAKMGFRQSQQELKILNKFYKAGLLNEAHLVTDEQDLEVCGYQQMR